MIKNEKDRSNNNKNNTKKQQKIENIAKEKEWSISKTIEKLITQELKRAGGTAP